MPGTGRVVADDIAHQASKTVLSIVNSELPDAFKKLNAAGNDLIDPQHWDGNLANEFRGNVWPKVQADLAKMQTSLVDLQQAVDRILGNISQAGGN
jgi:hypothetical protein